MEQSTKILLTLTLVLRDSHVLLGMKKRGFGAGRWNGFGGKVHAGESIVGAAQRELTEECGIVGREFTPCGVLRFTFEGSSDLLEVHVFRVTEFAGEPCESEEMRPQWFDKDEIPLDQMWEDDRYWLPLFFRGVTFEGQFYFSAEQHLLSFELRS